MSQIRFFSLSLINPYSDLYSSFQFPPKVSIIFFRSFRTTLLVALTDAKLCSMLSSLRNHLIYHPLDSGPLPMTSVMDAISLYGYRARNFSFIIFCYRRLRFFASTHLDRQSMATIILVFRPIDLGLGMTKSIPHCVKGRALGLGNN